MKKIFNQADFLNINAQFKWSVNDSNLPLIEMNINFYQVNVECVESLLLGKTSFKIGEFYMQRPVSFFLSLYDPYRVPKKLLFKLYFKLFKYIYEKVSLKNKGT